MAAEVVRRPSRLAAWWDSDLCWSFRHTPSAVISAALLLLIIAGATFAPLITPQNPFDLTQLFLDKAELPPASTRTIPETGRASSSSATPCAAALPPLGKAAICSCPIAVRVSLMPDATVRAASSVAAVRAASHSTIPMRSGICPAD